KHASEHRVPAHQLVPRLLEEIRRDRATHPPERLCDVRRELGLEHRVEEHSLLHRRERVDVLDLISRNRAPASPSPASNPASSSSSTGNPTGPSSGTPTGESSSARRRRHAACAATV